LDCPPSKTIPPRNIFSSEELFCFWIYWFKSLINLVYGLKTPRAHAFGVGSQRREERKKERGKREEFK
jgi:hypothetical protein